MNCVEFDNTNTLENIIKNVTLLILPSPLWAIHIDPKCKYVVILHAQLTDFEKLIVDKGILITFDELQKCIKTTVLIHNEIISVPSLQYTVHTVSDLSQLVYNLHRLTLCKNSNNSLEHPHCAKYVKLENGDKVCSICNCNSVCNITASQSFYEYTEIDNFNCSTQNNIGPILDNCITDSSCDEISKNKLKQQYICRYCNESFVSVVNLNLHLEYKCVEIKNYENSIGNESNDDIVKVEDSNISSDLCCEKCEQVFDSAENLKTHIKSHTNAKFYVCTICNKSSSQRSTHYKHIISHEIKKPNLCNICGKTFCRGYKIEDHMLTHSEEKPYECLICHKMYASKNNLRIHEETHKGNRPYTCKICNKTFTTPSNLNTHVKSVHKKVKPHQCGVCDMSFLYPQLLKIHMRKHTGEKPYKCNTCGKSFSKKIHLTVHSRTHTGEKPFICSICGKGFTTTGNLSSHKKVHIKENGLSCI